MFLGYVKGMENLNKLSFMKMHGLGNDFVIFDLRDSSYIVDEKLVISLSDRNRGVGFDQLVVISSSKNSDLSLTFFNADGSRISTCGNATRCVAHYEMKRLGLKTLKIMTDRGLLQAKLLDGSRTTVNMGHPFLKWNEIPLSEDVDTLNLPIEGLPTATGMGNPHCTFFVDNAEKYDLNDYGKRFEKHPLFPHGTNIQIVNVTDKNCLRMRVWERGVGHTLASGSSACASAVAATRLGLTESLVTVHLDGGQLEIDWQESGVWMTGESTHVFSGYLTDEFLLSI